MRMWGKALVVCVLAAALAGCGDPGEDEGAATPESASSPTAASVSTATAQPSPTATPAADPVPTATPSPAAEAAPAEATPEPLTQTQSIIFYDLTEIEKTCPGYQEFTGFRQTVSQVKITCTGPGVETVYFVDLENLVVTGIRVPLLEQEIP